MRRHPTAIDLFAGAGGMSEGLEQAGISVRLAVEINHDASTTYKFNHPKTILLEKDVSEISRDEILDLVDSRINIVTGGPPCQGFSTAGKRNALDERNFLLREFLRIVSEVEPNIFLMENVPGIISISNGALFKNLIDEFESLGYNVSYRIIDAVSCGVPQARKRVFLFGSKKKVSIASMEVRQPNNPVSVQQAISDLEFLDAGQTAQSYATQPLTDYQAVMRKNSNRLFNHESPGHSKKVIARFSKLEEGQSVSSLPKQFRTKKLSQIRLNRDKPSRTVTTLPDDFIHYRKNRILTVRELARLQSFRDSYIFYGPKSTGGMRRKTECPQYTQVGNSVPPLLAGAVGKWISGIERLK